MELTRIEKENIDYFAPLCPDEILHDDDLVRFGVIDDEGEAISMCAVGVKDTMAILKWIYTDPKHRELGAASLLMEKVSEIVRDTGADGIETAFLSEDMGLDDFLAEHEFLVGTDSRVYSVPLSELLYSPETDQILYDRDKDKYGFALSDAGKRSDKIVEILSKEYELDPAIFDGISGKLSVIYINPDKKITGGIFISEHGDDLYVRYMLSDGTVKCICELVGALYDALTLRKSNDGNLVFTDRDERSVTLVEKLAGYERDSFIVSGHMYGVKLFV